uniref:Uncharacterized protein n=1 Tax=Arundo donax TaxID=35708 RepID=A0A0A8Y3H6_ARUDO
MSCQFDFFVLSLFHSIDAMQTLFIDPPLDEYIHYDSS